MTGASTGSARFLSRETSPLLSGLSAGPDHGPAGCRNARSMPSRSPSFHRIVALFASLRRCAAQSNCDRIDADFDLEQDVSIAPLLLGRWLRTLQLVAKLLDLQPSSNILRMMCSWGERCSQCRGREAFEGGTWWPWLRLWRRLCCCRSSRAP